MAGTARERIGKLLDAGSFVEVGAYVSSRAGILNDANDGDGVATGYGTIDGALVYVYAQDPEVYGGSVGEMGAKKISALADMALKMRAPFIALIDCAGVRLNEGSDSLYSFGRMFSHSAKLSGIVPQITAVLGSCGGGMAIGAAMSDFVLMEKDAGKLFINSPNAVKDNYEEKCDSASAEYQSLESGVCDFSGTQDEIFEEIRQLIGMLPESNYEDLSQKDCTDDLNRSVAGIDALKCRAEVIRQIADDGYFLEIKKGYAGDIRTGFIRLNGRTAGVVANGEKRLTFRGIDKACDMVNFCDAFSIPVLTLVDAEGFDQSKCTEKHTARSAAKLTAAFAGLTVPSVTVITGSAYGSAGVIMNSRSIGADIVYAWTGAKMGLMEKELLSDIEGSVEKDAGSALYNARRGYVDDIIDPAETRQRVAAAFEMLFSKDVMELPRKHPSI